VTSSTFTSNRADNEGGAIDSADNNGLGTLSVSESTFASNNATRSGGAVDSGLAALTVKGSTFSANSVGTGNGGAIDNGDNSGSGTLLASEVTIKGNTAGKGGGIYNGGGTGSGTASIWDTTFAGNHASSGASVADLNIPSAVFVAGDVFSGSCAQGSGTWIDKGFNAATDTSCVGSQKPSSDKVSAATADLGALTVMGGPTPTVPLLAANPALGPVPASTTVTLGGVPVRLCARTDQRGVSSAAAIVGKAVVLSARVIPAKGLEPSLPGLTGSVIFIKGTKVLCQTSALSVLAPRRPLPLPARPRSSRRELIT
jgi:hypothetical protein